MKFSSRIRPRRVCAAVMVAGALAVSGGGVASAHDAVIGGSPADGATVEEFPRVITLEFSGVPQGSFNTVAVSDQGSGEVLFSGEPELSEQFVTLKVPEDVTPGPGEYVVGFQITSSDGHATRGKTTFTVAGSAAASEVASSSAVPAVDESAGDAVDQQAKSQKSGNSALTLALWLGVAVAIGGGIAAIIRSSRKR